MDAAKMPEIVPGDADQVLKRKGNIQPLNDTAVEMTLAQESYVAGVVSAHNGLPYIPLKHYDVHKELVELLSRELATRYRCFPVDRFDTLLTIAIENPLEKPVLDRIGEKTGCSILCYVSTASEITDAIEEHYKKRQPDAENALELEQKEAVSAVRFLVDNEEAAEKVHIASIADQLKIPPIDLTKFRPAPEVLNLIPRQFAIYHKVVPIAKLGNILTLAMVDPGDVLAIDNVRLSTGLEVRPILCCAKEFREALDRYYIVKMNLNDMLRKARSAEVEIEKNAGIEQEINIDDLIRISGESSIIEVVNCMLVQAVKERSSDIHIEPFEDTLRLRYRIDGILYDSTFVPKGMHPAIVSRIKIMANLDISERRLPQDGSFKVKINGREIDFRVSCVSTAFGEKVVLRVLDRVGLERIELDKLGFHREALDEFRKAIRSPYGIILLTGPTGSGKSTTLHSALKEINNIGVNIVAVEDPIEYHIKGITQIEVKPEIGLTFAIELRSILRQDPDIIMVGEIRDMETADIAVKAALTGHLVFSTLHTNDAASAITRLEDMGIQPFLISSSTLLVAAQRLIRRLCPKCKKEMRISREGFEKVQMILEPGEEPVIYGAMGCPACNNKGYLGRMAIIETIAIDDDIKSLIVKKTPAPEIKAAAVKKGMKTLRMIGLERVKEGLTTLEEVLRVTGDD
jgi:type IV pilus assembly protein PilB